jgi:hypothetical protein
LTPDTELFVAQRFSADPIVPLTGSDIGLGPSPLSTRETTIGILTRLGRHTSLSNRYQLDSTINGTDSYAVLGVLTTIPVSNNFALDWSLDNALHVAGDGEGYVGSSVGLSYLKDDDFRTSVRYELRHRSETEHIVNIGGVGRLTSTVSMLARYRLADIPSLGGGRVWDAEVALALRPRQSDRTALLFSYDQENADGAGFIASQVGKTERFSTDGYVRLTPGLESYSRVSAVLRPTGEDQPRDVAWLVQSRLQQALGKRFDIAVEGRFVREIGMDDWKTIGAVEGGFWLSQSLRIGIGYSTRGFQDPGSLLNSTAARGGLYLALSSRLASLFDLMGGGN